MIYHDTGARSVAATRRQPAVRPSDGDSLPKAVVGGWPKEGVDGGTEGMPEDRQSIPPSTPLPLPSTDHHPRPLPSWEDAKRSDLYALRITREWSIRQIACLYDVSQWIVRRQLRLFEIPDLDAFREWHALPDDALIRLYLHDRLSHAEIGARYGVQRVTVGRRLVLLGITGSRRGRQGWATLPPETLVRLYWDEGLTPREIGSRYSVCENAVLKKMARCEIPRRGVGGAGRVRETRWHALSDREIAALYHEEDLSQAEIARRYGVIPGTVRTRLNAIGCPLKHRGYHAIRPAWYRHENSRREERHALHLALYRRWLAGQTR